MKTISKFSCLSSRVLNMHFIFNYSIIDRLLMVCARHTHKHTCLYTYVCVRGINNIWVESDCVVRHAATAGRSSSSNISKQSKTREIFPSIPSIECLCMCVCSFGTQLVRLDVLCMQFYDYYFSYCTPILYLIINVSTTNFGYKNTVGLFFMQNKKIFSPHLVWVSVNH